MIGLAGATFPFLYALSPATWYWQDGRYAIYLGPMLAILVVSGWNEAAQRVHLGSLIQAAASFAPILAVAVSAASFSSLGAGIFNAAPTTSFIGGWGNPGREHNAAIRTLEVRDATRG